MKQNPQKSESLSLVPTDVCLYDSAGSEKSANLRDSLDVWLNSVAPTMDLPQDLRDSADRSRRRLLTLTEVTRVNFATVREGTEHRHWPPEVVLGFLAADVIKRKTS